MDFEFDPAKSAANRVKHGIDFDAAQLLWQDASRIEASARTVDEPRWLSVGRIDPRFWTAVFTIRENRIRIISVRRSRQEEVDLYEG